jgi:hypothetical protein
LPWEINTQKRRGVMFLRSEWSLKDEYHRGHLEDVPRLVKFRDRKGRDLKGWAEGVAGIPSWTMLQV